MPTTRPSIARLVHVDTLIRDKCFPSLQQLAEACGVHARTIKRDLQVLREQFDAPIAYSRAQKGFYYAGTFTLANSPLSEGELLALSLMASLTATFHNTPFAPSIRRALEKLQVLLPEPIQLTIAEQSDLVSGLCEPTPPERLDTIINFKQILCAMQCHHQLRMTYYTLSRDATYTRVVDPYHLYYRHGMWYLHAWCYLRGGTRDFAVERIRKLDLLTSTFTPPDPTVIRQRLAQRFSVKHGEMLAVAIRFTAEAARVVRERVWHSSQQIEEQEHGAIILRMQVEGLESVARWVLGFGRQATPLEPPSLVDRVKNEIQAMAANMQVIA